MICRTMGPLYLIPPSSAEKLSCFQDHRPKDRLNTIVCRNSLKKKKCNLNVKSEQSKSLFDNKSIKNRWEKHRTKQIHVDLGNKDYLKKTYRAK